MEGELKLDRVLVAHRGEIARRLLAYYRERGIETVIGFSEADADASWLDEADYDAYLNGLTVQDTYLNVDRVVSMAMDAGCDAVHPGNGFLAERVELYVRANNANLAVMGADPTLIAHASDPMIQRTQAEKLGLPMLPASGVLDAEADGVTEAASVGVPLWVRAAEGPRLVRVTELSELDGALAQARHLAGELLGEPSVYLERDVEQAQQLSTTVMVDRRNKVVPLGTSVAHLVGADGATWLEELGPHVVDAELTEAAVALVRSMRWVGPATVRWVRPGSHTAFFQRVSMRLTTGYDLTEAVQGVDLIAAHHDVLFGRDLGWPVESGSPLRTGLQARLLHVGGMQRVAGVLETLNLPPGATVGVDQGSVLGPHTEPLLAKITVVHDDREQAIDALVHALAQVQVAGVPTNLEALQVGAARLAVA